MGRDKYDVIIIGAGIGGLVCGCYLRKFGKRVLIIEKNHNVGGYVTTIRNGGYNHNLCIRGFVGGRSTGIITRVLNDLNIQDKVQLLRPEIYDVIQYKNYEVALHNDPIRTKNDLIGFFPKEEEGITRFFNLLLDENKLLQMYAFRSLSFEKVINDFFINEDLRFIFNAMRIDSGESPSKTSALADFMLIKGNVMDGGYFPKGGMHALPEGLEESFLVNGGEILKGELVEKISFKHGRANGVCLLSGAYIKSEVVVSNSDATYTYVNLFKDAEISPRILNVINSMKPSASVFILHIAFKKQLSTLLKYKCAAIWNFSKSIADGIVISLPTLIDDTQNHAGADIATLYFGAPFWNLEYWHKHKERFANMFLKRFLRAVAIRPEDILFTQAITPCDLENLTLNRFGASRGWSPISTQVNTAFPGINTPFNNVYLVGQWVNSFYGNGGIAYVANLGKRVAHIIAE